jgi:demethylmenaquinone methyltransferase / 2-methoxy-6-polyprenyl-1,4-benzoquinol methylase
MNDNDSSDQSAHFGFRKVAAEDKGRLVAGVFNSVADKYDIMNDLMSLGLHRLWKRFTIELSGVGAGQKVLDVASGTGDLAAAFAECVGNNGFVVATDINNAMLARGRDALLDRGISGNIGYSLANAEHLPFPENCFDCVSIAFGLRNVTHISAALAAMQRVLKPGGRLLVLEFSRPLAAVRPLYDVYSKFLPWLGKLVARDAQSYRYLVESIRMHPDQETLKLMMLEAGFAHCDYYNLSGGIVALHRGYKL